MGKTQGHYPTLPETNSEFTPENQWLEYNRFHLARPIFRGELLVSGSVITLVVFYKFCNLQWHPLEMSLEV